MKVTNTIKDYIRKKVREAYAERMGKASNAYQTAYEAVKATKAATAQYIDKRLATLLEQAVANIGKLGEDLGAHVVVTVMPHHYNDNEYCIRYEFSSPEADTARQQVEALEKQRTNAIEDIIVSLELGADKDELERRLANL